MQKVKNRKTVTKIAVRSLKARGSRNLIAVFAIILTSVLFTALFTIGGSLIAKSQESTMRQVGGSAHAGYKYLTEEEYKKVAADPELQDVSYRIAFADAANKSLVKVRTEMSYYEDLNAKQSFCYPEEGHMPKEKYDFVASDLTLKALGIPCEIGQKATIEFTLRGEKYSQEFTLSGWYKGDRISMSQAIGLSKEFVNEMAPSPTVPYGEEDDFTGDTSGRYMVDFNFKSSFDLEGQLEKLNQRLGFEEKATGVNWGYMANKIDPMTVIFCAVMLGVILLSGYLIIYNIFYINVFGDICFYGLLKTIGTTERQLCKIVRRQAYFLSAVGIPLGLLLGYLAGAFLLPYFMNMLTYGDTADNSVAVNPWIFIGAAAFSFVTVYISCIKPCHIAAKVSPVEAVRFTEGNVVSGKNKKQKKTKKVSMHSFALANLKRSRKKTVIVILSLSISLVLLNSVYSILTGFDMDKYVASRSVSDFMVSDATVDNAGIASPDKVIDGVTEEFLKELEAQTGIEEIGSVYLDYRIPKFTEEEYERFRKRIWSREDEVFAYMLANFGENFRQSLDYYKEAKTIDGKIYGLDRLIFEKLKCKDGELDWEKFATGKYVITNSLRREEETGDRIDFYDVGEKVRLVDSQGENREYEVLAIADIPYAAEMQSYGILDVTYILPTKEFLRYAGEKQPMKTLFNVASDKEAEVESWLEDYCSEVNSDLGFTSKKSLLEEFDNFRTMFVMVGGLLTAVLALIGILNFVNTMVTGILSRKQEFAMLEAVGMTGKQLQQMLMWEGGYHALFTVIGAVIAGGILSATVIRNVGGQFFFFTWKFTVTPILFCLPFIFFVVLFVPAAAYRQMCRISVVERIRTAE